jgi:hypothetical protein
VLHFSTAAFDDGVLIIFYLISAGRMRPMTMRMKHILPHPLLPPTLPPPMMTSRRNARPPWRMTACSFFIKFLPDALVPDEVMHLLFPRFLIQCSRLIFLPSNSVVICFYFIFMFGKRIRRR